MQEHEDVAGEQTWSQFLHPKTSTMLFTATFHLKNFYPI